MLPKLGGMLRYGIPNYRLPKEKLDEDINAILETGVQVEYGHRIGIEGEDADGVISAVQFLRDVGKNQAIDLKGKEVCVIGGGNVSMDAVRTALRDEIDGAIAEGVEVQVLKAPVKICKDADGRVTGLEVQPQMISSIKNGRASVKATGEENFTIPCQTVIVAIGQDIAYQHFADAGVPVNRGVIQTQRYGGFDLLPGVFAGGDCATGPATVVRAIGAAKVLAANIDEYLGYHHSISSEVEVPQPNIADRNPCGRVNMTEREACERICDFEAWSFP